MQMASTHLRCKANSLLLRGILHRVRPETLTCKKECCSGIGTQRTDERFLKNLGMRTFSAAPLIAWRKHVRQSVAAKTCAHKHGTQRKLSSISDLKSINFHRHAGRNCYIAGRVTRHFRGLASEVPLDVFRLPGDSKIHRACAI